MATQYSTRNRIPRPQLVDTPVDFEALFIARDAIIDKFAESDGGTLASRPTSSPSTPGVIGRTYVVTDQPDSPRMDYDFGTGWNTLVQGTSGLQAGDLVVNAGVARAGCLLCDGAAYSRSTYMALYDQIGIRYGAGDGSTTFNVPDFRDKVAVGAGGAFVLAANGGENTHVLTTVELAAHNHGVTDPQHNHTVADPQHRHDLTPDGGVHYPLMVGAQVFVVTAASGSGQTRLIQSSGNTTWDTSTGAAAATGITINNHTTGISIQNAGGGAAHNNMQKYAAVNVFIKT